MSLTIGAVPHCPLKEVLHAKQLREMQQRVKAETAAVRAAVRLEAEEVRP
jgi:hypothetical protein